VCRSQQAFSILLGHTPLTDHRGSGYELQFRVRDYECFAIEKCKGMKQLSSLHRLTIRWAGIPEEERTEIRKSSSLLC
jgi:hypothetical protein